MPNTVIAASINDGGVVLDLAIPLPELRLALPAAIAKTADLLSEPQRSALSAYLSAHCSAQSASGAMHRPIVTSLAVWEARDDNVGVYQELRARMFFPASDDFNPRDFQLKYDAVIHQVPNHFALVQITRDFRAGMLSDDRTVDVGVIRFDFARNDSPPLRLTAASASLWTGFRSVVTLGFHHVATGFDHVLFLITLLIVAPLREIDGRWSLFQGWQYAARRFLRISLAFTAGHSVALLVGAYELIPIPRAAIEVLIAASIVIAALHAIRPLFAGREWLVAAVFGTVHGFAFSESLAELALTPWIRAVAVGGFNVGVEGAQLVAMACAVPLLAASRFRFFHALRVWMMVAATVVAGAWMVERGQVLIASQVPRTAEPALSANTGQGAPLACKESARACVHSL
ncbi:MAG: HupE/UreJ family protein [Acidobacteria bacterium]|nr:HupE/UreJ family protein [Acidobacteriota bacterium]